MEPLLQEILTHGGGPAILAGILYLLHRDALKAFRDELKTEREVDAQERAKDRAQCHDDHAVMVAALTDNTVAIKGLQHE
jgi:hypothetical protein